MKRSSLTVTFVLAGLLLLSAVSSFAASTWTVDGTMGTINNVQTSSTSTSYIFTMNLLSTVAVGNVYSVYLSPTQEGVFTSYTQELNAAPYYSKRKLTAAFDGTDYSISNEGTDLEFISSKLSDDKKSLTWEVASSDVTNNFWFGGEVSTNDAARTLVDRTGVAATPIPGAVWLLGSGILGLVGLKRRQNACQPCI